MTLECLDLLEHDPRYFTTSNAVRDLDRVRDALGYEELNIYGVSYGTRVAQQYMRVYPERARAAILDGLAPASIALGPDTALESQKALDALFERCETDTACSSAFPDFRDQFYGLIDRLDAESVEVTFTHPRSGATTTFPFGRATLAGAVRLLIYSPTTSSMLPVLINEAARGHFEPLAALASSTAESIGEMAQGLNFSVLCTEDAPYWGSIDRAAQAETYMGSVFMDVLLEVCKTWPKGPMDTGFKTALESDIPTLILTGEFDPITPARYVPFAAPHLTNHIEVLAKGQGHGMLAIGCIPQLMSKFIDEPDPRALDVSCAERITAFPLFTSPLGPAP